MGILKPKIFVELGVHSGNSYNAFCQAVKMLELNTQCYGIDTWQGDEHAEFYDESVYQELLAYQEECYQDFSYLLRGYFDEMLESFEDHSIDLLHIDGFHTYDAVKHDFDNWLPKISDKGVIIFHDTAVREHGFGVWRLWEEISTLYPSFNFTHGYGLGILAVGKEVPQEFLNFLQAANTDVFYQELFFRLGCLISLTEKNKSLELQESNPSYFAQLFIDVGNGFNEDTSLIFPVERDEQSFEFDLSNFHNIVKLRFDPLNAETILQVKQLTAISKSGKPIQLSCHLENVEQLAQNIIEFKTHDPQMLINLQDTQIQKLIIIIRYLKMGRS